VKKNFSYITIGIIAVGILLLYMATFTVRWQEKALVLTFGKIERQVDQAGLNWIAPWQSVVKFDGRIRTLDLQGTQTVTRDMQNIIVTVYVNWRISDAQTFYERFRSDQGAQGEDVVYEAQKRLRNLMSDACHVFTEYNLSQLVTLDRNNFKLPLVEKGDGANGQAGGMLGRIREKVAEKGGYGIEIIDIGIKRLGVPDSVTSAVFARMTKERNAEAQSLRSEGAAEAASIIGRADSEAGKILAQAKAKEREIKGQGDAEAAQYYSKFLAHPSLAMFLRKLETLRTTLSDRTTLSLDSQSAPYNLLMEGPTAGGDLEASWLENIQLSGENQDD
jgi:membrane protease subunit HflC